MLYVLAAIDLDLPDEADRLRRNRRCENERLFAFHARPFDRGRWPWIDVHVDDLTAPGHLIIADFSHET
jgi:hypothetical protein